MGDEAERIRSADSETPVPGPATKIGSYRLSQPLGSGGMSSVFLATHEQTGLEVALKILPRSLAKNTVLLQRFLREAKIAESLEHSNIVAIYDRGTEQGRYYLVLEYVPGGDLHEWIRTHGPMPVDMAIVILKGVVSGLDHAARQGLIHRDIKPANILLTAEGTAKVTDLGLAVQLADEDERVTRDGTTVGTVDYMSPEQARDSRSTTVRSDIYSLGCTLYHLLAGVPPFSGGTVPEKLKRHATEMPREITSIRPDVPESLARILRSMLSKKPEQRFGSYGELLEALEAVEPVPAAENGALYALVDDEDSDSGGDFLLEADDDDALIPLSTKEGVPVAKADSKKNLQPTARRAEGRAAGKASAGPELDLGALAELDEESEPSRARGRKSRSTGPGLNSLEPAGGGARDELLVSSRPIPQVTLSNRNHGSSGNELQEGILRGLLIGGALVIFGLVVVWAIRSRPGGGVSVEEDVIEAAGVTDSTDGSLPGVGRPPVPVAPESLPRRRFAGARPAWNEPDDVEPSLAEEPALSASLERGFEPSWVQGGEEVAGPVARVSRIAGDSGRFRTIREALGSSARVVEVADDGPLFVLEGDFDVGQGKRVIRAAAGNRPLVVLEFDRSEKSGDEESLITVEEADVVLEGLDLIVDMDAFPASVASLFHCPSGSLTLRDCSVTVVGGGGRRVALARAGENLKDGGSVSQAPRILLERTWLDGPAFTAVQIMQGGADVVLSRCVVLSGRAPVIAGPTVSSAAAASRGRVFMKRSILVSSECVFEFATTKTSAPMTVRALGNTMARQGREPKRGSLIVLDGETAASLNTTIDWAGDHNEYLGWNDWLTLNRDARRDVKVADLGEARELWAAQEARSLEGRLTIEAPLGAETRPVDLEPLLASSKLAEATLDRVRDHGPYLVARGVGEFAPLAPVTAPPPPDAREVVFSTAGSPWNGDLGRFLHEQFQVLRADLLVVRVKGQGSHVISPVEVPEGVSLWVEVDPPAPGSEPVVWTASPSASSTAFLISLRRGDLTLKGVQIDATGLKADALLRVEEGHLALEDCRFLRQGSGAGGESCLISMVSTTTREVKRRFAAMPEENGAAVQMPTARIDRCILDTAGVALRAELGRGEILVRESAVVAGASVFHLVPSPVSRRRFLADLRLERSTLAAGQEVVRFEAWTGLPPGPDRPWLVTSNRCVFLDVGKPRGQGALLRLVPDAAAQRGVFWQSRTDDYEVAPVVRAEGRSAPVRPREARLQAWAEYWGQSHVVDVQSPDQPGVRATGEDLTPGEVRPDDLELESVGAAAPPTVGAPAELFEEKVAPATEPDTGVKTLPPAGPAPARPPTQGGVPF